jgi:translation initiation factor 3 subunit E
MLYFCLDYEDKAKVIEEKKSSLEKSLEKMLNFIKSKEVIGMLKEEKLFNMSYIKTNFQFEEAQLEMLFDYAKLLYETGQYTGINFRVNLIRCY